MSGICRTPANKDRVCLASALSPGLRASVRCTYNGTYSCVLVVLAKAPVKGVWTHCTIPQRGAKRDAVLTRRQYLRADLIPQYFVAVN
ncbi:hypothetical protein L226DRAFT_529167 [Lentinus tigrinus ALCF2SS1-7]|uniref:Uncharacterized protein n=1 Tax=Lentinus tigrinus ALCF2SS1-6 TaxID=1328759 RepID=A0A5C2SS93_9APHY|nr:hypothetical protein L227DRAFT_568984 [Lentinus tigrinus ALCF2SS1-6]RPD80706.1 hypothetical protein L226DRAFT_529167 [Lentinus tigrinus ALCF2SS1-7]